MKNCNWGGKQGGLGGGFCPPSLYVKRGPDLLRNVKCNLDSIIFRLNQYLNVLKVLHEIWSLPYC